MFISSYSKYSVRIAKYIRVKLERYVITVFSVNVYEINSEITCIEWKHIMRLCKLKLQTLKYSVAQMLSRFTIRDNKYNWKALVPIISHKNTPLVILKLMLRIIRMSHIMRKNISILMKFYKWTIKKLYFVSSNFCIDILKIAQIFCQLLMTDALFQNVFKCIS